MINQLLIKKESILTIPASFNAQQALDVLEDSDDRCGPVVDQSNTLYRGNVYRYHLYQHLYRHPDQKLEEIPVTRFLKNTTHVFRQDESIFQLFLAIRDLPYVAVLNEAGSFAGIIRHRDFQRFYTQVWGLRDSRYILEIRGKYLPLEISKIQRLMNRYTKVQALMMTQDTDSSTHKRLHYVFPQDLDILDLHDIEHALKRRGYQIKTHALY